MHSDQPRTRVVIAGGGTAGWVTAAALARQMGAALDVTLVESAEIGTVGVGESTIPPVKTFHRLLRIDEPEFMRATQATFKLGIWFENWKNVGDTYFHSFGQTGKNTLLTEFIHFWMRGRQLGMADEYGAYCTEFSAALKGRCAREAPEKLNYAFHLDSSLYAKFLRQIAEAGGVKRIEGKIKQVKQDPLSGDISALVLEKGQEIPGDLFIDCTGMRALLIEQTLHTGYEDWGHWLPCESAIAVQTESVGPAAPYTMAIAHDAGWRWRIPLQSRVGNGIVFCSRYLSEDEAHHRLLQSVQGAPTTEPRLIKFRAGRRLKFWNKNCIAIGLSSGFLEPLESTSIHLIMTAITRLLQVFPRARIPQSMIDEYNQQAISEIERIRDFIIVHYKITERDDSPFWRYCRNMELPAELAHRIQLFRDTGKIYQAENDLFRLDSWTQVMLGQGIYPETYHPIVDTMPEHELKQLLSRLRGNVERAVDQMSEHEVFLRRYCAGEMAV